jgi:hypothetical protein
MPGHDDFCRGGFLVPISNASIAGAQRGLCGSPRRDAATHRPVLNRPRGDPYLIGVCRGALRR